MGRTRLSQKRLSEIKKVNIGHIVVFCEGNTEKYYFDYFAKILNKNKYTNIEVVLKSANGNAQGVLNYANDFLSDEKNNQKFANYKKYLVFDCDAPENIQAVILSAAVKNYELLVSNYMFETWLLMHFEDVEKKLSKRETYKRLTSHLNDKYKKGFKGKTCEIIQNGSIEKAIENAKLLEKKYNDNKKNILTNINDMNPYSNVYKLIEQFMAEISAY